MSALTEQVAREHRAQEVLSMLSDREGRHLYVGCTCGVGPLSALSHAAHIAAVTEQAVRANVAAEIRAIRALDLSPDCDDFPLLRGRLAGLEQAARITERKQP